MSIRKTASVFLLLGILIGIYNGRVALWKDQDPEPYRVFPYPAAAVPAEIREALEHGIRIDSEADLEALLENLLS